MRIPQRNSRLYTLDQIPINLTLVSALEPRSPGPVPELPHTISPALSRKNGECQDTASLP